MVVINFLFFEGGLRAGWPITIPHLTITTTNSDGKEWQGTRLATH